VIPANPVLHVNAETTWRGGENQVFLLAAGMQQRHPCAVACVPGASLFDRLTKAGVPTQPLPGDRGISAVQALRRAIRVVRPGFLHAHTSRAHQLCLLAAVGLGVPVIVTRRINFPLKWGPFARWKYRSSSVFFVAISQAVQRQLLDGGVAPERVAVIPSGIDFSALDAVPRTDPRTVFNLPADAQVVINVGALGADKDQATLLRAWALVESQRPRAHLVIMGEGGLRGALEELRRSLGIARAHLVGYRTDVPSLLKGGDVFVMSSQVEGLCTSIMDAKRCGLPVVATRAGGIPEVVDEYSGGRLVAIGDHHSLACEVGRYLDDETARRVDAEIALKDSARFTAQKMVDAYVALYQSLREQRSSVALLTI
jgi:glycosyltransferase involved in cell wall biosynthesis